MHEEEQQLIESYILGAAMSDPYALKAMLSTLTVPDFYFLEHRSIYEAMKTIYGAIEEPKLDESLLRIFNLLNASGKNIPLKRLLSIRELGHSADVDFYIQELKTISYRARVRSWLIETAKELEKKEDPLVTIESLREKLSTEYLGNKKDFIKFSEILDNYAEGKSLVQVFDEEQELAAAGVDIFRGFRSGYPKLDSLIGGFANGTSNIVGARSSSGKTTLLINLILNLIEKYQEKIKIGFFSLEMTKHAIADKIICTLASIPYEDYENRRITTEQFLSLGQACQEALPWNLYFFRRPKATVSSMRQAIRMAVLRNDINFVMTDYLTLIQADRKMDNKHLEIDAISKMLQNLSKELNIPFVTLAQLNRAVGIRADKRPILTDLRESGSIEEDSDLVLLMHRPAHYDTNIEDHTEIIVAKNRMRGQLGKCAYKFDKGRLREFPNIDKMRPDQVIAENEKKNPKRYP